MFSLANRICTKVFGPEASDDALTSLDLSIYDLIGSLDISEAIYYREDIQTLWLIAELSDEVFLVQEHGLESIKETKELST